MQTPQSRRRKPLGIVLAAGAVAAFALPFLAVTRYLAGPPAPVHGATRTAFIGNWQHANPSRPDQTVYFWLGPHELLGFTGTNRHDLQAVRYDTRTGREMPIPGLTKQMRAARVPRALEVSPDGKWLLWVDLGARAPRPIATTTDGLQTFRWPQGWHNTNLAWLPDSRGWLRMTYPNLKPTLQTYRIGSQQAPYTTVAGGGSGFLLGVTPQGRIIGIGGVGVGFMDTGLTFPRLRTDLFSRPEGMPLTLHRAAILTEYGPTGADQSRVSSVILPPGVGGNASVTLSPDGTRLGWLIYTWRAPLPIELSRARLTPPFNSVAPPRHILNLFVSKRDGTGMREIGQAAVSPRDRSRGLLRWTPDGTRLSFVFENALWTVPVP